VLAHIEKLHQIDFCGDFCNEPKRNSSTR
jgi:hypothetical protein